MQNTDQTTLGNSIEVSSMPRFKLNKSNQVFFPFDVPFHIPFRRSIPFHVPRFIPTLFSMHRLYSGWAVLNIVDTPS